MDFIKRMRKREFIEMTLKAIASILAVFAFVILLECMIYGIKLKAVSENMNGTKHSTKTIAYCIKQDDNYLVLYHYKDEEAGINSWISDTRSADELTEQELSVYKIVDRAPTAFEFETIEGWHFAVMAVLVVSVSGFFTYKFVRLGKSYKKIEEQFLKDGTIEITNVALEN